MVEVVVVGAGIAGVAAALELAARGAAVNLVEESRPASAATGASAGMLAPQYESPGPGPVYRLGVRSRTEWSAFAERLETLGGRSLGVRRDGMLVANWTGAEEEEARTACEWQRESGATAELLTPAEARDLQEGLGPDARSWLWLPDEGQVDAQRLVEVFEAVLRATGIRLLSGVRVRDVAVEGGAAAGVVMEDGRRVEGDRVVLAAGAWSGRIGGPGATVPVRPVRGQMLRFEGGPGLRRLVASHAGRYLVPRDAGSVVAGSTMEDAGFDRSITEEGERAIRSSADRLDGGHHHPGPDVEPLEPEGDPGVQQELVRRVGLERAVFVAGAEPQVLRLCVDRGADGLTLEGLAEGEAHGHPQLVQSSQVLIPDTGHGADRWLEQVQLV
ncbi:MAG: FAD-dependent oxidoreductase, partial [Gemmatimonadota bacterium]